MGVNVPHPPLQVQVARLDPVLCNAASWAEAPSPLSLNSTEQFTAAVTFKQQLLAEFDAGDIHTCVGGGSAPTPSPMHPIAPKRITVGRQAEETHGAGTAKTRLVSVRV